MGERVVGKMIGRRDVVHLHAEASVREASRLMAEQAVGAVVGIISLRDFVGVELQQAGGKWGEKGP